MATIEKKRPTEARRPLQHPAVVWSVALICVGATLWWVLSLRRPPQMGPNDEVFRTVDALFTAVTAHDEKLLAQCETRLHTQREVGHVPPEAAEYLDNVIQKARGGSWQSAAERLYDFMRVQRRDGFEDPPAKPKKPTRAPKK